VTPAELSSRAQQDLLAATRWIEEDNPRAAEALLEGVRGAARLIGRHPDIGRLRPEITAKDYRFLPLTGFPYVLVYDPRLTPPLIARILHGARDLPAALRDL
jgi:toxin ParE1/3/4